MIIICAGGLTPLLKEYGMAFGVDDAVYTRTLNPSLPLEEAIIFFIETEDNPYLAEYDQLNCVLYTNKGRETRFYVVLEDLKLRHFFQEVLSWSGLDE